MYGWGGRRNYSKEVKLVRVKPYDNSVGWHGKSHKAGKVVALLVAAVSVLSVCLFGFYYVFEAKAEEKVLETTAGTVAEAPEKTPEEIWGAPVGTVASVDVNIMRAFSEEGETQDAQELQNSQNQQDAQELQNPQSQQDVQAPQLPLVAIDPGHGGGEEGCNGDGTLEAQVNLELARRLSQKLQELGFETLLIREDEDTCLTQEQRLCKAEEAGADIYVSLHGNSGAGIETWYCVEAEGSRRLAQLIQKRALGKTGAAGGDVQERENLGGSAASMPSCTVEAGFQGGTGEEDTAALEYQDKLAEGIAQGIDLYFNPRTMYLTFDDGPSKDNTTAVLDTLKEKGIKATFFVVGENVRKNPEVARRIVEEGHTIGIHCNRHVYEDIYQSVDSYLEDFQEAYDAVYEVTGVEVQIFRFPGGSINSYNKDIYQEIIEKMEEKGFIYFDWNASLEDAAKHTTPQQLVQNAIDSAMGRKKVIMLAHDIKSDTVQCLEELIDSFPEYKMEPLTTEVDPIHF